jgi:3-oxoacyl-[acyl-carrier protein] reductase
MEWCLDRHRRRGRRSSARFRAPGDASRGRHDASGRHPPDPRQRIAAGASRHVNVASIIAFTGYSGLAAYAATKSSMIGFTRSLAREVGRFGITVNAVAPGFLATDMTSIFTEEQRQQIVRRTALRRFPEVDDVANAVEYLLGDKARNVTGTVLTVDAGATA